MNRKSCPQCGSSKTKKNGTRNGIQLYKCLECKHQFRSGNLAHSNVIWDDYQNRKQTIKQLAELHHLSPSSIKRKLYKMEHNWQQPDLSGKTGYVHLDVTYWGHNWGVLLALDDATGKPLYLAFIKNETTQDYRDAIDQIISAGYTIKGLVVDGKKHCLRNLTSTPYRCVNSM